MYINDEEVGIGDSPKKPEIKWNAMDRYAIIAFLLKSIDKNAGKDGLVRFDDLFGLKEKEMDKTDPGYEANVDEKNELIKARDTIISECEKFIATLYFDNRYDCIVEEIDRFIEGGTEYDSTCVIGSSYGSCDSAEFLKTAADRLIGDTDCLFPLVKFVIDDADYDGNKRRLLKHIARKWNLANTVLPEIEDIARKLSLIEKEQREAKSSDKPYPEVIEILAALEEQEKAVWEEFQKLSGSTTGDEMSFETEAEDDDEESNCWEKATESICEGIQSIFGGISDGLNDLAMKI
jgi:hypothetical protein